MLDALAPHASLFGYRSSRDFLMPPPVAWTHASRRESVRRGKSECLCRFPKFSSPVDALGLRVRSASFSFTVS